MSLESKLEINSAQWEPLTNSKRDLEALRAFNVDDSKFDSKIRSLTTPAPELSGFILRKDGKALGYILLDGKVTNDKRILVVKFLHIEKDKRRADYVIQLLSTLKGAATSFDATHIGWNRWSSDMGRLSRHIRGQEEQDVLIPIEQFRMGLFTGEL